MQSCQSASDGGEEVERTRTIPAAPPPTMTMFFLSFLPFLSKPSDDMIRMIAAVQQSARDAGRGMGTDGWRAGLQYKCAHAWNKGKYEYCRIDGIKLCHVCNTILKR